MSFPGVTAYDEFMGRFSAPLAVAFADWVALDPWARVLDVGSGPGALTAVMAARNTPRRVTAIDPSEDFIAALRERLPDVAAVVGTAEALPFPVNSFDAALSELAVHFLTDAPAGIREMVRVTRPGGTVAACVWDFENDRAPQSVFLRAAREVSGASARDGRPGTRRGHLKLLLTEAGCRDVVGGELSASAAYESFDEWWDLHLLGVGSAAGRLDGLDAAAVEEVRRRCHASLGDGPFRVEAVAWTARGTV
ncbi:class I SAM-dependent methyltransferase [Microbacterium sp. T2.11-28]|uniref:class I SAM-dependent methyltransferase n=1 Tax=unclassified Microbacterium TaxID=2609290 RepID=UPI0024777D09|nr:class I SAM-dependent methyltransferase [Microbacterium sp. T2.11-28]CAI9393438.1 2-methoxy-6-polyprenyl-1,4-benzoquinol methylase, mitochondrial [Microbacterium sp. T2.11-28]